MIQLFEIRDSLGKRPALEHRKEVLEQEINRCAEKSRAIEKTYEKEMRDVALLEEDSFFVAVRKLFGRYEGKLEKEQREALAARRQYDRSRQAYEELTKELAGIENQLKELDALAEEYKKELEVRRAKLRTQIGGDNGEQLNRLEKERDELLSEQVETREALHAAQTAKETTFAARDALNGADGWATYDVFFKGGLFSHMAKYEQVDEAEECFNRLSFQLETLQKELLDLHGVEEACFQRISSGQRAVDFWFDNIFTDLSVRGQIRDNLEDIEKLMQGLNAVTDTLYQRQTEISLRLEENQTEQEAVLLSQNS